jgi:predicted AAA+ superfamily ATPase
MIKGSSKILELIQVTFGSSRQDIRNTEISNLITASKSLKCENLTVVTWDYKAEEEVDGKKIKFVPLWRWLLNL